MSSSSCGPLEKKSFRQPDKRITPHETAAVDIVSFHDSPGLRRVTAKPGWKWSTCTKAAVEGHKESCSSSHVGVMNKGKLVVQMKDGNRETFCAGDAFHIPPGHDAFVEGDEEVEFIEFDHKNS